MRFFDWSPLDSMDELSHNFMGFHGLKASNCHAGIFAQPVGLWDPSVTGTVGATNQGSPGWAAARYIFVGPPEVSQSPICGNGLGK